MTTDDERIAYLGGDDAADQLDDTDRSDLDETRALLADPSVWAEPPNRLEGAVVAAVSDAAVSDAAAVRASPTPLRSRRARARRVVPVVGAVAAAVALVVAVSLAQGPGTGRSDLAATLRATELVPGAAGRADFTRTDSGWRIDLDATGLTRLEDGVFYQAWLRNDAGVLVAIGTFNEPHDVVLWAGVSPLEFSTITVTREPADDDPGSSGQRVLVGSINGR
jgi:hypothetical protein